MDADVCMDLVPEQGKRKQGRKDLLLLVSKNMFGFFWVVLDSWASLLQCCNLKFSNGFHHKVAEAPFGALIKA